MAARRRIGQMMGGMRLGDMAAALEGRQMRRAEQRDADEREARRLHAGNVAISQILGGINDYGARVDANKRQAMLDEERRSDREFERSRLTAEDERRAADHAAKTQDRLLARLLPGLEARADESLEPDATGAWIFGGDLDDPDDVQIVDARGNALHDMVTTLESAGLSRAEAESLAKDALRGAESRQAQRMASAQAAERQALDDERKARIAEAQAALAAAKTETERARARKLLAEARRASRPPSSPTGAPGAPSDPRMLEGGGYPVRSESTATWLGTTDALIDDLSRVLAMIEAEGDSFDSGPAVEHVIDPARRLVGMPNKVREDIRSTLAGPVAQRINQLIGAAQTETELKNLAPLIPRLNEQEEVFIPRLRNFLAGLEQNRANVLRAQGIDPSFRPGASSSGTPAVPSTTTPAQGSGAEDVAVKQRALAWMRWFQETNGRRPTPDEQQRILEGVRSGQLGVPGGR